MCPETRDLMRAKNDNRWLAYFQFLRCHIRFLVSDVSPISRAFLAHPYLEKVTAAHCLIFGGSGVMATKVGWGYFTPPPISNTRVSRMHYSCA